MVKRILKSRILQFFVLAAMTYSIAGSGFDQIGYRETIRFFSFDKMNRLDPRAPSDTVAIIDIDEETLKRLGQWPFSRDTLAQFTTNMKQAGVKVTAFDMVFPEADRTSPHLIEPDRPNHDDMFAQSIGEAGNVVMGFTTARAGDTRRLPVLQKRILMKRDARSLLRERAHAPPGVITNLPVLAQSAQAEGAFIATPDSDGIIRRVPAFLRYNGRIYPSLSVEALRVALADKQNFKMATKDDSDVQFERLFPTLYPNDLTVKIGETGVNFPLTDTGKLVIKFRNFDRERMYVPFYKVLDPAYQDEISSKLKGKIALVGTSAEGLKDIRSHPLQAFVPGVEVHANMVEQILQGDFLFYDSAILTQMEHIYIFFTGLMIILLSFVMRVLPLTLMTSVIIGLMFSASFYAYREYGFVSDPIYPSLCLIIIYMATVLWNYVRTESVAREIRSAFGLYISPQFMQELTENPEKLKLGGEIRELTVMFTDIRNFTTISENMTPEELIMTMNDFLTPMSDVVMEKRGTIDKYMGDAMMAFWNAPLQDDNHAAHAVEAALEMRKVLEPVNKYLEQKERKAGREPIRLAAGIGINTGECSVGNMGSKQRFAYSALGDAVNLASRLEGQTKTYGLDLLIGEETAAQIKDFALIEIDKIQVKGRTQPVRIYTALGGRKMGKKADFRRFRIVHKQFLRAYRRMQWDKALQIITELQATPVGKDLQAYYSMMQARITEFKNETPPQNWDGVYIAKSK